MNILKLAIASFLCLLRLISCQRELQKNKTEKATCQQEPWNDPNLYQKVIKMAKNYSNKITSDMIFIINLLKLEKKPQILLNQNLM